MKVLAKVVGRDEMVTMCGNVGDGFMLDRTDLVQRYEVSAERGGYSLCEYKNDGSVINKSRYEVDVLPLSSSHRQAFYELGVAGIVSNLTSGRNGASYMIADGGAMTRKWILEGTQHYPGVIRCAVDQLFVDMQALRSDQLHERTIKLGVSFIQSDAIHDCLPEGKPQKRSNRRPVLAECRKTKSVVIEGVKMQTVTSAPQMLQLIEQSLATPCEGHTVVSICVECTPLMLTKTGAPVQSKVHWLHFISLSADQPVAKPRGGGNTQPTGFRGSISNCLAAIRSSAASIPYHRNKLTFFLRPALTATHPSCFIACLAPFSPFSNVGRAGDSLRDATIYSSTAAELAATVDERLMSSQPQSQSHTSPVGQTYANSQPTPAQPVHVYDEHANQLGYSNMHASYQRQHTSCLQGWDGSTTLTDLTNPPTPAPLDFGQSPPPTKERVVSPRQPPTHHIVKRSGSSSPARARSPPSLHHKEVAKQQPLVSHVNTSQPYSYSSFKKAITASAHVDETPQVQRKVVKEKEKKDTKQQDDTKFKAAVAETQAVRQEFEMYRSVMDATLLRLKSDVSRLSKEKEELKKVATKKERTWRKEQSEVVTLSKDLRLATKRIEELEAQRAQLQGEFHEELVKLDKRQQVIIEDKLKMERGSHEAVIRVGQLEEENDKLVEAIERNMASQENLKLREENTRLSHELQVAKMKIQDLMSHHHTTDALELPSAIGGWDEEPSIHVHEVVSEYIPSEAPTGLNSGNRGSMKRPPPPKTPPSRPKGKRAPPPKPPPPKSAVDVRAANYVEAVEAGELNTALQRLIQPQLPNYSNVRDSPAESPEPKPERQVPAPHKGSNSGSPDESSRGTTSATDSEYAATHNTAPQVF